MGITCGVLVSQEEEESPAEGSKDEPAEQGELKEEAAAPAEETPQPPPSEPKGDAAREGEKPEEKDGGDKSEPQVSHLQRERVESRADAVWQPHPSGLVEEQTADGSPYIPALSTQKPNEKGQAGPEGAPPAPEQEKKQKPARKQKMVEEIGVELAVLDLPDLPEGELARSVQK